jgi:hypothetical protein
VIKPHLRDEIQTRLGKAVVEVVEARISHLDYAQEIAQAMIVPAGRRDHRCPQQNRERRRRHGGNALDQLSRRCVVDLDEER